MGTKTRYTMVNKSGKEIFHADSFMGFIGGMVFTQLMVCIVISLIGAVICGVASLFG